MQKKIEIAAQTEDLKDVRGFVLSFLSDVGLQKTTKHQIILAIDEVCANIIIHSDQANPKKSISLVLSFDAIKSELNVSIKNHGKSFDYKSYHEPVISQLIAQRKKGGIGLYLVRKIMDNIDFLTEGGLNITTLTKKINPSTIVS